MPSGSTELTVMNKALILLGDREIVSRTDNSTRAKVMDAIYDGTRDRIMRECPWNFATKQVNITKSTTYTVLFDFDSAYPLPADFLYMLRAELDLSYRMQDNHILADETAVGTSGLNIEYVRRVEDMSTADTLFVEALAYRLAYEACERITESNTKRDALLGEYELTMSRAKRLNGQEDFPQSFVEDAWVTARL